MSVSTLDTHSAWTGPEPSQLVHWGGWVLPTIDFGCAHNVHSMTAKRTRKRVASVREYVASKPKESRASLEAVRRAILKALPNAQEGLAYQMPAYTLNGVGVLYFAGWKSHYSLYPASDVLVEAFAKELAPYERSKGTLKFPLSEPVPVRLIERIAKFRARQLTTRDAATGRRKGGREGPVDRIRRICAALPSAYEKCRTARPVSSSSRARAASRCFRSTTATMAGCRFGCRWRTACSR